MILFHKCLVKDPKLDLSVFSERYDQQYYSDILWQ